MRRPEGSGVSIRSYPFGAASPRGPGRRDFLKTLAALGTLSPAASALLGQRVAWAGGDEPDRFDLADFAANVEPGGPAKDGIPAIDDPKFTTGDPDFLSDDDVVFGIVRGEDARAYPQLVLVWHEIVNDQFDDGPLSVTYCPLTGSVLAFRGTSPEGKSYTFGTSGRLVNSNLLMYDRQTDSRWPQVLGQAIKGPGKGQVLEEIPLEWTTWRRWREAFPGTRVLTTETGYFRDYGLDPYGAYEPKADGYYDDSDLLFSVMRRSRRFAPKEIFIGAKRGRDRVAVRKRLLRDQKVVTTELDDEQVVFLYDPTLREGRAFASSTPSGTIELSPTEARGEYVDEATGDMWDSFGQPEVGLSGARPPPLTRIPSLDVMWFAWFAFFPETKVIG